MKNLKELRTNYKGSPYRSLFVFDFKRSAVLLVGGDKTAGKGSQRKWYRKNIAIAEERYDKYLKREMNKK